MIFCQNRYLIPWANTQVRAGKPVFATDKQFIKIETLLDFVLECP
jgi:hypothetical protein